MNLVLLNYNNYFNRIVKTASHISDYLYLRKAEYIFNVNFNPNDGVETEQVINWKEYWTPDYLLEYDPSDDSINSRWFIIEWVRLRNGQYRAKLRRDLLADYYSEIKDSPIFVERATLIDSNNRLIFNPEGFNPNQIKNDEILLKDKSGCPWLVAYLQKGTLGDATSHGTVSSQTPKDVIEIATAIRNWKFYDYREKDFIKSSGLLWVSNTQFTSYYIKQDGSYWYSGGDINAEQIIFNLHGSYINYVPDGLGGLKAKTDEELGFKSDSDFAELFSFNGKIVKDTDGKYYRVQVINSELKRDQLLQITPESYNELYGIMSNLWVAAGQQAQDANYLIRTDENCYRVILTAVDELTATWSAVSTTRKTNNPLYDIIFLPYADKVIKVNTSGHSNMKFRITKESAMDIMNAITKDLTSTKVLDLQLLPYCPVQSIINDNGEIILTDEGSLIPIESSGTLKAAAYVAEQSTFTFDIERSVVIPREKTIEPVSKVMDQTFTLDAWGYGGGSVKPWVDKGIYPVSVDAKVYNYPYMPGDNPIGTCEAFVAGNKVFYSIQNGQWANFDVVVKLSITGEKDEGYKNQFATDLKISNECDKYRLCSPNYNGLFEFSLAKNDGSIDFFNVDCTYRPYNPYIHVNPNFKGLYGKDYNDARGLICGGDFSLGIINDQWNQYEIQNKNYQNIFDRQIQNMDVNNAIVKQEAIFGMTAGTIEGIMNGALGGAMMTESPIGAGVGAGIGGMASLAGGIADIVNLNKRVNEQRDFSIDMFNYRLGNIKALPYSITRTSAITANNKLFPFLEIYNCSKEERTQMENQIKYRGMTIMAIGTLSDYMVSDNFFKGQLIRNELIRDDAHVFNEIYNELNKGVYF